MVKRHLQGFVGVSLAATLTGCHIPANSPFTGLAQIRPVAPLIASRLDLFHTRLCFR